MVLRTIARVDQLTNLNPLVAEIDGIILGVYKQDGHYYAYENVCAHQGGPVCEGQVMGKMVGRVSPSGELLSEYVSNDNLVIACPWHGVEYDIKTGECDATSELRLRSFPVVVEGQEVKVDI